MVLNPDEGLLDVRVISHAAVIVRQTNEQVKRAHFIAPDRKPGAETAHLKNFRPNPDGQ